jgi:raffinose/stachyose/melibiose transport system substrate-binding protein
LRLKHGIAALAMGALALPIAACAQGSADAGGSESLDVRVYGDWLFVADYAEAFKKANPDLDVDIEVGVIDGAQMREQGGRLFESSDAPDLVSFTMESALLEDWTQAGVLTEVGDVWENQGLDAVLPDGVAASTKASEGPQYVIPFGIAYAPQIYLNVAGTPTDALPTDHMWEDQAQFLAALESVEAAGSAPALAHGGVMTPYMITPLLVSACGSDQYVAIAENWKTGGSPSWEEPCVVDALEAMKQWSAYTPEGAGELSWSAIESLFTSETSPMWANGSWGPPVYEEAFEWDWANVPPLTRGEPQVMAAGVDTFLIPKGSKNPEVAKQFLEFMMDPANMEEIGLAGRTPVRNDVDLTKVVDDEIVLEISEAALAENAEVIPWLIAFVPPQVLDQLQTAVSSQFFFSDQISAEEAAALLQAASERYLEGR